MRPLGERVHLLQDTEEVGLGDHQGEGPLRVQGLERGGVDPAVGGLVGQLGDLDALVPDDGADHLSVGGVHGARDQHPPGAALARDPRSHQHRLGERGGPVVERGVGGVEPRQRRHHRLELVEELQRPLARLGLIGRVGGVELAAPGDLPDRGRQVVVVGSGADEAERAPVVGGPRLHQAGHLELRERARHALQPGEAQPGRDLGEQLLDALHADCAQHLAQVFGRVWYVAHPVSPSGRSCRAGRPSQSRCRADYSFSESNMAW